MIAFCSTSICLCFVEIFGVQANDKDLNSFSNVRSLGNNSKILYDVSTFILNFFIHQASYKSIFDCTVFVIILNKYILYIIYIIIYDISCIKLVKYGYYWPSINKSVRDLYRVYHVKNYKEDKLFKMLN